jgi:hypothetical protein
MMTGIAMTEGGTLTEMEGVMTGETIVVALVPRNVGQRSHPLRPATKLLMLCTLHLQRTTN